MPPSGVPRARTWRVGRARPGTLRLWTLQPWVVWERLRQEGSLYVDPDLTEPFLRDAYDWLRGQMAQRIPGYEGHYPWWSYSRPKPSLSYVAWWYRPPDQRRQVRLELAVEPERVLELDNGAWLQAGDGRYVALTRAEWEAWDAELAAAGTDDIFVRLPEPWQSRREATWPRVFNLDALAAGDLWPVPIVEAVFEWLDLRDVVAVTEFWSRREKSGLE